MSPSQRKKASRVVSPANRDNRVEGKSKQGKSSLFLALAPAVVLVVLGQIFFFRGDSFAGIILTLAGALVLVLAFVIPLDFSKVLFSSPPSSPVPPPRVVKKKLKYTEVRKADAGASPAVKFTGFSKRGVWTTLLLLAALWLGVKGQIFLSNMSHPAGEGLKYYFGGVVLFLTALWPWKKEGLKLVPLRAKTEWTIFGAIMILAAFLRVYKLGSIPSGIFFDMGFQGYGALKILHEGWRPFDLVDIGPMFPSAPAPIYLGALWFIFFKNTQFNLNLFYVCFCLASFPLIYWTFRQLAGPRVALLTLFILAVMRWNWTFARNSFPPSLMPFFMFGTLALLLYGLRTSKRWPFIVGGVLFGSGLYTYQSYQAFPLVVFLVAGYECVTNWKAVKTQFKMILVFSAISLALAWPMIKVTFANGSSSTRVSELSIMSRVRAEKSWAPLIHNTAYTALMFNRRGDPNPRHNLQDHRQLDDITGFLLFFGFFYALFHFWRRKYFYALAGFFVMSLPCLLTIDPAHSSRMYGMTAFVAFLAASTLAALWGRIRAFAGLTGELLFLLLLIIPCVEMTRQNYKTYFIEQAGNTASWAEFSIVETTIGRKFAEYGDDYDCYVSPRFYGFFTIDYLDYFFLDHVKRLDLPDGLAALPAPGRGLLYGLEMGRTGVLEALKSLYPGGEAEILKDPNGAPFVYFYRVPPEVVDKARGLTGHLEGGKTEQFPNFPEGLPVGLGPALFTGDLYIGLTGDYQFDFPKSMTWSIGGKPVPEGLKIRLVKGIHPVEIHCPALKGFPGLSLSFEGPTGKKSPLGQGNFLTVPDSRGLKAQYYSTYQRGGPPFLEQWEPVMNFVNGNDFPSQGGAVSINWSGVLDAPESGNYRFFTRTSGQGGLKIDGRSIIRSGMNQGTARLEEGPHSIDLSFSRASNLGADFSFLWMKPGDRTLEVVPETAFGEVR